MMKTGLVSVTFRQLSIAEIVDLVRQARQDAIEWGGDVHVPHGNLDRAREARRLCDAAGIVVSSYGSYYRVGGPNEFTFDDVLACAKVLGARQIRVWAGRRGSADADAAYRLVVGDELRALATRAAAAGMGLSMEFHGHTLTDTAVSTRQLLDYADHPALWTYWQPPTDLGWSEQLAGLRLVRDRVSNLHVFAWQDRTRHPLAEAEQLWTQFLAAFARDRAERYALLEFVRDDRPEAYLEDAATLRELVKECD